MIMIKTSFDFPHGISRRGLHWYTWTTWSIFIYIIYCIKKVLNISFTIWLIGSSVDPVSNKKVSYICNQNYINNLINLKIQQKLCTKAYHIICSLCRSTHVESNKIRFSILRFLCDLLWFFKHHIIYSLCRSTHVESNKIEFFILWFLCDLLWFFKDSVTVANHGYCTTPPSKTAPEGKVDGFEKFRG
jgi:hypothetical protein